MPWFQIFEDGVEYEARRRNRVFVPPNITLKDVHDAVPRHLFERSWIKSIYYISRHLFVCAVFFFLASRIEAISRLVTPDPKWQSICASCLWVAYWGWQGFCFAGIWCLGHDAGHDALFPSPLANATVGLFLHTFVLTPYYAWRATHRTHHVRFPSSCMALTIVQKSTNNLERDETYLPPTRKSFKLPDGKVAVRQDYVDVLEETPAYTLFKLLVRQFLGFQLYLLHNRKGNPKYPKWTSHYLPSSLLFKPDQRSSIIISDIAIFFTLAVLSYHAWWAGGWCTFKYYFMPWLFQHNWMVLFTYLQHSDPTIPYYRKDQWTFARGCLATVDRPLFGWAGRFFLHGISSDHVAHHFFSSIPFYNLPEVTAAIKPVLGEYYNYDSTGALYALWRSFTNCVFVEDEGDVVFFKNQYGEAILEPADTIAK